MQRKNIFAVLGILLAIAVRFLEVSVDAKPEVDGARISASIKESTGFVSEKFRDYTAPCLIVIGAVLLVIGSKLVRPIIYVSVAIFTFLATDQFLNAAAGWLHLDSWAVDNVNVLAYIAMGVGLVAGLLALFIVSVGLFLCGCAVWYFVALWAYTLPVIKESSAMKAAQLPILVGGAILSGLLFAMTRRALFVPLSALVGAVCLFFGIDLFASTGFSRNLLCIVHSLHVCDNTGTPSLPLYLMSGACLAAAIAAAIGQYVFFSKII